MNNYQKEAHKFAFYNDDHYPEYGLVEEVGEFMGKIAKSQRGDQELNQKDLKKELGDILWMLSEVCTKHNFTLQDIADSNLNKLKDRQERGVLSGNGDNR